ATPRRHEAGSALLLFGLLGLGLGDPGRLAGGDVARASEQPLDRLGRRRALALPVRDAGVVDDDVLGVRVVSPEALEEAAVARTAGVRGDDAVIGALLGAHAGEPDLDGHDWVL